MTWQLVVDGDEITGRLGNQYRIANTINGGRTRDGDDVDQTHHQSQDDDHHQSRGRRCDDDVHLGWIHGDLLQNPRDLRTRLQILRDDLHQSRDGQRLNFIISIEKLIN